MSARAGQMQSWDKRKCMEIFAYQLCALRSSVQKSWRGHEGLNKDRPTLKYRKGVQ